MLLIASICLLAFPKDQVLADPLIARDTDSPAANVTKCNDKTYTYEELAGYGKLASNATDKFGDTIGGFGSAIAVDKQSWEYKNGSYQGTVYGLPDRGWNTQGTQNTQSRIHIFSAAFTPVEATVANPADPNFEFTYKDTIPLTGPDGAPLTGLDATDTVTYEGFPTLPLAKYTGNGFGQDGPGGARVALDAEGLVLGKDGTYWINDEYATYIYQFDKKGKMINAIRPSEALIPRRNDKESFSSASPPIYDSDAEITPEDPDTGRGNNQGLEALTASPDGKYLYTMLQSATIQDGGSSSKKRRNTRLLKYHIQNNNTTLEAEYIVQLPILPTEKVASQSEMIYISSTQFLVLARDTNAGHGAKDSESIYRNADIIDISKATNVAGKADESDGKIASKKGKLKDDIVPAVYCPWLSYNNNDQLNRFGVHNGGCQDANLLNEKWESFGLVPVDEADRIGRQGENDGEGYYLLSFSDNDFMTQNGFINSGKLPYQDASGPNVDNQVLVFRVTLPKGVEPL